MVCVADDSEDRLKPTEIDSGCQSHLYRSFPYHSNLWLPCFGSLGCYSQPPRLPANPRPPLTRSLPGAGLRHQPAVTDRPQAPPEPPLPPPWFLHSPHLPTPGAEPPPRGPLTSPCPPVPARLAAGRSSPQRWAPTSAGERPPALPSPWPARRPNGQKTAEAGSRGTPPLHLPTPGAGKAPPTARSLGAETGTPASHGGVPGRLTHHDVSTGQLEGLRADERRHHVEQEDEGHDKGDRQEQHGSGCTGGRVAASRGAKPVRQWWRWRQPGRGPPSAARRSSSRPPAPRHRGKPASSRRRRVRPPLRDLIGCPGGRGSAPSDWPARGEKLPADWLRGGTAVGDWSPRVFSRVIVGGKGLRGGEEGRRRRRRWRWGERPLWDGRESSPGAGGAARGAGTSPHHVGRPPALPAERKGRGQSRAGPEALWEAGRGGERRGSRWRPGPGAGGRASPEVREEERRFLWGVPARCERPARGRPLSLGSPLPSERRWPVRTGSPWGEACVLSVCPECPFRRAINAGFGGGGRKNKQKKAMLVKSGDIKHLSWHPHVLPKMSWMLSTCLYTRVLNTLPEVTNWCD